MKSAVSRKTLYNKADYAGCFHDEADLIHLPNVDSWLVRRKINGSDLTDLINPYPIFKCQDFSRINEDIQFLSKSVEDVSLTLRTDPFDEAVIDKFRSVFDYIKPFKKHYITNLITPWRELVSRRCKRYACLLYTSDAADE